MPAITPSSKVPAFAVEQWMDKYELTPGVLNLAETCAASIAVDDLVRLNSKKQLAPPPVDFGIPMTYGDIRGSDVLRRNIAALYASQGDPASKISASASSVTDTDVIVTTGAISANYLVFYSLVEAGDHVITIYPTYQQLYSVPASLGAEVSLWKLDAAERFLPNVDELEKLIRPNTKMIVINNPNNPSGATIPDSTISRIIQVAKAHNIILFSDEVYAPLFHGLVSTSDFPQSAITLGSPSGIGSLEDNQYDNIVATGSMSKAWALAGIRVGWAVSRNPAIREAIASARDYTTISVSQIDDQIARYALGTDVRPQLAERNIQLARKNLALLTQFVEGPVGSEICDWVKPTAGTTAFIRFYGKSKSSGDGQARQTVDDVEFCRDMLDKTKVMFVPGSLCFGEGRDFQGYVRIGYVCHTDVLIKGLTALEEYVTRILI